MRTLRQARPPGETAPPGAESGWSAQQVLPAELTAVRAARAFASATLARWQLTAADDVLLVLSELAANAVAAADGSGEPEILVRLIRTPGCVIVEVGDHVADRIPEPSTLAAAGWGDRGRGLIIARALSLHLCWCNYADWKLVWARIVTHPAVSGHHHQGAAA